VEEIDEEVFDATKGKKKRVVNYIKIKDTFFVGRKVPSMRSTTLTKLGSITDIGLKKSSFTSCLMLQYRSIAPIDPYKAGGMWSRIVVADGVEQVRNAVANLGFYAREGQLDKKKSMPQK
jgi:hypothetical protein